MIHNNFDGMMLNSKEKSICRKSPLQAISLYRHRTKSGLKDAKMALENELGMEYKSYNEARDIIAFSFFYIDWLNMFRGEVECDKDLQDALKDWRKYRRLFEEDVKNKRPRFSLFLKDEQIYLIGKYYELADKMLRIDNRIISDIEEDARFD